MVAHRVYHWKHGWIPLDHVAAISKAKGSEPGARKYLAASHAAGHAHSSVVEGAYGGGTHIRGLQPVAREHLPRESHITAAFDPSSRKFGLLDASPQRIGLGPEVSYAPRTAAIPEHLGQHLHDRGYTIKNVRETKDGKKILAERSDGSLKLFAADGSDINRVDPEIVDAPPRGASAAGAPVAAGKYNESHTLRPSIANPEKYWTVRPVSGFGSPDIISRALGERITQRHEKVIGYERRILTTVDPNGEVRRYKANGSNMDNPVKVKAATAGRFQRKDIAGFTHVPAHEAIPNDGSAGGSISALKVKRAYVKGNKRVLIEPAVTDAQAEEFLANVDKAFKVTAGSTDHPVTIHVPSGDPQFRARRGGTVLGYVYGGDASRVHINPKLLSGEVGSESPGFKMDAHKGSPQTLYTLVHELGHVVDNKHGHIREEKSFVANQQVHTHRTARVHEMDFHNQNRSRLSRYGATKAEEGYAEAFAQHHLERVHDPNSPHSAAARDYAQRYKWQ